MSKNTYKEIKKGDEVLVLVDAWVDWGQKVQFWIPGKVERTTKTQIIVNEIRYKKENGKQIGGIGNGMIALPGMETRYGKATDESKKLDDILEKKKKIKFIREVLLKIEKKINIETENIDEIKSKTLELLDLMKKG